MLFDVDAAAAMGKIPRGGSLTGRELTAVLSFVLVKPSRPRYEVGRVISSETLLKYPFSRYLRNNFMLW